MIKFKLGPFKKELADISYKENETIKQLCKRAVKQAFDKEINNLEEQLLVTIEGEIIPSEMWDLLTVEESTNTEIIVKIKGGSFGPTFQQIAIVAVVIAVAVLSKGLLTPVAGATSASAGAYAAYAGIMAVTTIGATLLFNALIPPPTIGGFGFGEASYRDSQMFSLTGQSNRANPYGSVHKVYGTHRVFPTIAANPYIDFKANDKGELEQYFVCIYDFGLGPNIVENLQIGETPIGEFTGVEFNYVDLNKPDPADAQPWEEALITDFQLYKGVNSFEQQSVVLNNNEVEGVELNKYQVTRNFPHFYDDASQELSVFLTNPRGLYTLSTAGSIGTSEIFLKVEYADVGNENWKSVVDAPTVEFLGQISQGTFVTNTSLFLIHQLTPPVINPNPYERRTPPTYLGLEQTTQYYSDIQRVFYSPPKTMTTFYSLEDIPDGRTIRVNGTLLGVVASRVVNVDGGGGWKYTLEQPFTGTFNSNLIRYEVRAKIETYYSGNPRKRYNFSQGEESITLTPFYESKPFHIFNLTQLNLKGATQSGVTSVIKFIPETNTAKRIRVTRVQTINQHTFQTINELTFSGIANRTEGRPILSLLRHTFFEIRIKATDQLNGNLDNLSAVVTSVLPVYDEVTETWVNTPTNNPAWIFCDIITGVINKRRVGFDRIHTPSILEWATFCDEIPDNGTGQNWQDKRYTANFVLDFASTVQQLLSNVGNSAQASLNLIDGKYGVLLDKNRTIPVQLFTTRNSRDFSSSKKFVYPPDALRMSFVDPTANWEKSEAIVYDNGKTVINSEDFEDLEYFACTSYEQAWRYGRYLLAQSRLRKEIITIQVDFENLICTRGDYVVFSNDIMKVGGRPSRVTNITGNVITLDEALQFDPLLSYGYVFRSSSTGELKEGTLNILTTYTAEITGDYPEVGDLLVYGELSKIKYDCIVKSIEPANDLTAVLTLVERADSIHDAYKLDELPEYDPSISATFDVDIYSPPKIIDWSVTENDWRCNGTTYEYYINMSWDMPEGAVYELFEIYVNNQLHGYSSVPSYEYIVPDRFVGTEVSFKILAVSSNGNKIDIGEADTYNATPLINTSKPSDVEDLFLNITGEVLQIEFSPVEDCDVIKYLIRYSPRLDATWTSSIPLLEVPRNISMTTTQARTGTYLIKAVNFYGTESNSPAIAITTIPNLFNLNIVEETNDFPMLDGAKEQVRKVEDYLILQNKTVGGIDINEYYEEGYYYYDTLLDLGDIYTVRLQSSILAEGYAAEDLMANWVTLADVELMSNAKTSEWDVGTYVRGRDSYDVIADWTTLAEIDYMAQGAEGDWSPWRKFTISDFTARVLQFRLKLESYKASVTPKVYNGVIRADMPDRVDSYNNLIAPPTGYNVVYNPAFKGPLPSPTIQITQDDAEAGDHYKITSKGLTGFTIQFFDEDNIAVQRQFDVMVRGYGRKGIKSI